MELKTVKVSQIIPYQNNPRNNADAVDAVMESIKQCGYIAPIIVDEDMVVLAGHTRLKAIKKLKWEECQIAVAAGLTEEQKKKYRLLDNKTNEFAEWDFEALAAELEGMDFDGFDFKFDIEDTLEPISEIEKEANTSLDYIMKVGKYEVAMTEDEYEMIIDKIERYVEENGVTIGFVGRYFLD